MSLTMYDSDNPFSIPTSAQMVAGYVDGYAAAAWNNGGWARFPNAIHVRIAVSASTNAGDVLDVETGDATPGQAPGWVRMRQAAGIPIPSIYCNRGSWPAVQQAVGGLQVKWWIADWTGAAHAIAGAAAVQWADPSAGSGGHYDLSLVTDPAWPVLPGQPVSVPLPVPPGQSCPAGYQLNADQTLCIPAGGVPAGGGAGTLAALVLLGGAAALGAWEYERRHPGTLGRAERRLITAPDRPASFRRAA